MQRSESVRKLARLGMLAALSVALAAIVHFPLLPAAPYLEYDPADIPILIAAFIYGPWYGVLLTAVVSVIQGVTVSASGGVIGIIMHFCATGACCLAAGYLYRGHKSKQRALLALAVGVLAMTAVMCGLNYLLTPLYTGLARSEVAAMLLPVVVPFNLLKAGINAALTFFVYKPVHRALERVGGVREARTDAKTP